MNALRLPASRAGRILVSALLLSTALGFAPVAALAQTGTPAPAAEISGDTVVATVGGDAITEADIAFAAEDLAQELQQMPAEERKAFLVTVLIDMKVMAKAAREQQMDQTPLFKQRLGYLEDRALRRAYFGEKIATPVTPEQIQAAYDAFAATIPSQEEVHARHILVATEDEAKAIKAELDGGKDFAELAKKKSTDPSAEQNGGDLGFFSKGMMVKPFEDAAFSMEVGAVSAPIQSDFGWHVIKLEEKRMSLPPALEGVAPQLEQQIMFQNFEAAVAALKTGIVIDIPDAALAAGVKAQTERPAE